MTGSTTAHFGIQKTKTFCSLPWVNVSVDPDGSVKTCCISTDFITKEDGTKFNLGHDKLEEIYNSKSFVKIRQQMLDGVEVKGCTRCYEQDIQLGTVSKEDFDIGSEVIGIDKKQKAFDGKTLRYPTQIMADKGTDYLMIEIQQYVRNKSTENKLVRANTNDKLNDKASEITKIGSIILPIPSSIQDGNSVSYADGTLDSLSAAALQGVSNTIKDFNLMSGQTSQELTRQFTSNLGSTFSGMMDAGLKGQFIRTLASQAVSSIPGVSAITPDQFLARQTGGIMNLIS